MTFFNYLYLLQKAGLASANLIWTAGGMQIARQDHGRGAALD